MRGAPPAYQTAIDYLYRFVEHTGHARWAGYERAPQRTQAFLARLGHPEMAFPSLVVAGTKGKGSTAAMLEAALRACGLRVGLYTSPHLHSFRERIQVGRTPISQGEFVGFVDRLRPLVEAWLESHPVEDWPTTFELATVMAMAHFAGQGVQAAVLEVGRGGQFDAVNAVPHHLAAMATVGLDHTAILGHTVTAIAREKAGVIPLGGVFVCGAQPDEALATLREVCLARRARWLHAQDLDLEQVRFDGTGETDRLAYPLDPRTVRLPLQGAFQGRNLRLALGVLAALGDEGWLLPASAVRQGLEAVRWPGRFEVVHQRPLAVVDGAHNPDSAAQLRATLDATYPQRPVVWVVGASSGKDLLTVLRALQRPGDLLVATQTKHPRALPSAQVASAAREAGFQRVMETEGIADAWRDASKAADADALVCFSGSLFVVAEARELFGLAVEID
ncbi:MAG: bifunctional folylpolyglutamate synthase/dihydrofolate synthase [Chloroflexi bacterium]|nr:bifunctional folylpolyglutamate synthase/dihydrofolate synthase [Chloroflexota bacterium]